MLNYLERWIAQLRWQRLDPFQKLALMLLDHLDGILNYCRTKVPRLGKLTDSRSPNFTHLRLRSWIHSG
jgi:transposase